MPEISVESAHKRVMAGITLLLAMVPKETRAKLPDYYTRDGRFRAKHGRLVSEQVEGLVAGVLDLLEHGPTGQFWQHFVAPHARDLVVLGAEALGRAHFPLTETDALDYLAHGLERGASATCCVCSKPIKAHHGYRVTCEVPGEGDPHGRYHLDCLELRLGRTLTAEDFTNDDVNAGILFGFARSRS